VRRAWVILLTADGLRGTDIATRLHLTAPQVCRIRTRFERGGVDGLADQPKRGRGNNVPEEQVRLVVSKVMGPPPPGYSQWSTRTLAKEVGLGHTAVHDILRANDLKPHLQRTFKISRDPEFVEKVEDIVGLYLTPPRRAFVICMMRRRKSKRWNERNACCLCDLARSRLVLTTTDDTASLIYTQLSNSEPAKLSAIVANRTRRAIFCPSSNNSTGSSPDERFMSSSTTPQRTRHPKSGSGWGSTHASNSISLRRAHPG
jgi:transposase